MRASGRFSTGGRSADVRVAAPRGRLASASPGSGGSHLSRNTSASATRRLERSTWRPRRCGCSAPRRREHVRPRCHFGSAGVAAGLSERDTGLRRLDPQRVTVRGSEFNQVVVPSHYGGSPSTGGLVALGYRRAPLITAATGTRRASLHRRAAAAPRLRSVRPGRAGCSG
jgi:hypothetical protein